METITEKTSKNLKELIIINNDRYEGYKTAAEETKDMDLKALFQSYSAQSNQFSEELRDIMPDYKYSPDEDETKTSGKLYRVFMDMKAALEGKDRKGILASCEFGEDEAKKTYDEILEHPEELNHETLVVVRKQQIELQKAHDKIKSMRDRA
jgi:uncharacterized protein (TIGR02284 family)